MPKLTCLAERLTHVLRLAELEYQTVDHLAGLEFNGYTGRIARGNRGSPRVQAVTAIARVLGTSAEWLVDGVGRPPSREVVLAAVVKAQCKRSHVSDLTAAAPRRKARNRPVSPAQHRGE